MRISVVDLMSPAAVAVFTATVSEARQILLRRDATEVYVVDANGKLLGIVPDYEFLKAELSAVAWNTPVTAIMSAKVETIDRRCRHRPRPTEAPRSLVRQDRRHEARPARRTNCAGSTPCGWR